MGGVRRNARATARDQPPAHGAHASLTSGPRAARDPASAAVQLIAHDVDTGAIALLLRRRAGGPHAPPFVQSAAGMVRTRTMTDRSTTFIALQFPARAPPIITFDCVVGRPRQDAAHPPESTSLLGRRSAQPAPPASSAPASAASGARGSLRTSWLGSYRPGGANFKSERNAMDNAHTGGLTKALLVIATIGAINWGLIGSSIGTSSTRSSVATYTWSVRLSAGSNLIGAGWYRGRGRADRNFPASHAPRSRSSRARHDLRPRLRRIHSLRVGGCAGPTPKLRTADPLQDVISGSRRRTCSPDPACSPPRRARRELRRCP